MGFWGLGLGFWGFGFWVWGLGFRVLGLGLKPNPTNGVKFTKLAGEAEAPRLQSQTVAVASWQDFGGLP